MTNTLMIHPDFLLQDRYRVLKLLGKGGFGRTFEVDDGGTRKVLKILTLDRFQKPEAKRKAISLFQREAQVLIRLQHPGIPRVEPDGYFTVVDATGETLHCLVMEKIEGVNLKQWQSSRNNEPLTQEQAIAWLKQLAEILEQLHQQELVHRDIKPTNIMLRPTGQVVLVDFGAVREITETYLHKQENNVTGTVIISAGYTPPEQAEGHAVTQSDFFALGRTFVNLLTGTNPTDFDRDPRTGKLLWRDSAPHVAKELADLIDYLMAVFPGRRPQTPQMILRCLEEIVSPASVLPPPPPIQQKTPASVTPKRKPFFARISSFFPTTSQSQQNVWKTVKLRRTLSGHGDAVRSIAITPNGQYLASGSYDKTIKLWSFSTGELQHTLSGHTNRITCIAISPDSQILASGSYDRTIKLWALDTGELLHTLSDRPDKVRNLAFSPNGQTLISSGDSEIKLWATRTGKLLRVLTGNSNSARLVTFSPDGSTCAIGSLDGTLELWNPHNGQTLRSLSSSSHASEVTSLAFSSDGETLASGSSTGIRLWSPKTGKQLRIFSTQSHRNGDVAFTPDGQTLATASGKTIELWDVNSGKHLCTLSGHSNSVESVAFSADGNVLVSGSSDRTIKVWQPIS